MCLGFDTNLSGHQWSSHSQPMADKNPNCRNTVVNHPHGLAVHETPYPNLAIFFSTPLGSELPQTTHLLDAANGEYYPEFWIFLANDIPPLLFDKDCRVIPEHWHNAGLIIQRNICLRWNSPRSTL